MTAKMARYGTPKLKRLFLGRVVHGILEQLHIQIADRMPVDDNIELKLAAPLDGLIQKLQIGSWRSFAPCYGMDRDTYQGRAHLFHLFKMFPLPVSLIGDFIRIRNGQSAK